MEISVTLFGGLRAALGANLLDLNLPKMGGIEFLQELRADPALMNLEVIVLTSSNEPSDRAAAFKYEVNDYIVKPHSFDDFSHAMSIILADWARGGSG